MFNHHQQPDPEDAFRATLRKHGFYTAAEKFKGWIDFDAARRSWVGYPRCMDRYPTYLEAMPYLKPRREGLEGRYE